MLALAVDAGESKQAGSTGAWTTGAETTDCNACPHWPCQPWSQGWGRGRMLPTIPFAFSFPCVHLLSVGRVGLIPTCLIPTCLVCHNHSVEAAKEASEASAESAAPLGKTRMRRQSPGHRSDRLPHKCTHRGRCSRLEGCIPCQCHCLQYDKCPPVQKKSFVVDGDLLSSERGFPRFQGQA